MIIIISGLCGLPLPDRGLELLSGDIASLEHHGTVDLDGGSLRQENPVQQAEGRLVADLNVKGIFLLQLCDHGGYVVSPFPLRVVEIELDQHASAPFP